MSFLEIYNNPYFENKSSLRLITFNLSWVAEKSFYIFYANNNYFVIFNHNGEYELYSSVFCRYLDSDIQPLISVLNSFYCERSLPFAFGLNTTFLLDFENRKIIFRCVRFDIPVCCDVSIELEKILGKL